MPLIIIISTSSSLLYARLSQLFCSLYIRAHLKVTETKRFRRAAEKLFHDVRAAVFLQRRKYMA